MLDLILAAIGLALGIVGVSLHWRGVRARLFPPKMTEIHVAPEPHAPDSPCGPYRMAESHRCPTCGHDSSELAPVVVPVPPPATSKRVPPKPPPTPAPGPGREVTYFEAIEGLGRIRRGEPWFPLPPTPGPGSRREGG
jgi:hypothetical protein